MLCCCAVRVIILNTNPDPAGGLRYCFAVDGRCAKVPVTKVGCRLHTLLVACFEWSLLTSSCLDCFPAASLQLTLTPHACRRAATPSSWPAQAPPELAVVCSTPRRHSPWSQLLRCLAAIRQLTCHTTHGVGDVVAPMRRSAFCGTAVGAHPSP